MHPDTTPPASHGWLWDEADDNSPLGNDTGADTRASFLAWRSKNPDARPTEFFSELLEGWGVEDVRWDDLDDQSVASSLEHRHYHVLTHDDAVIGLAFAQLAAEGQVDRTIRLVALAALKRQALPAVVSFRGWVDPAERRERLSEMQAILTALRGDA